MAKNIEQNKKSPLDKTHNKRIIELINEYRAFTNTPEYKAYALLEIKPNAVRALKMGTRSFTVEQVVLASKGFGISSDWILGLSNDRGPVSSPLPPHLEALVESKVKRRMDEYLISLQIKKAPA